MVAHRGHGSVVERCFRMAQAAVRFRLAPQQDELLRVRPFLLSDDGLCKGCDSLCKALCVTGLCIISDCCFHLPEGSLSHAVRRMEYPATATDPNL